MDNQELSPEDAISIETMVVLLNSLSEKERAHYWVEWQKRHIQEGRLILENSRVLSDEERELMEVALVDHEEELRELEEWRDSC